MMCITEYGFIEVSAWVTVKDWDYLWARWAIRSHFVTLMLKETKQQPTTGFHPSQDISSVSYSLPTLRHCASPSIVTDICSLTNPNCRIKYNLCSVRSFSIVYLHLSSCVLHTGKRARNRGRGGAVTERLVASLQLPADTFSSHHDIFIN